MVGKIEEIIEAVTCTVEFYSSIQKIDERPNDGIPMYVGGTMLSVSDNTAFKNYLYHEMEQPLKFIIGRSNTWF